MKEARELERGEHKERKHEKMSMREEERKEGDERQKKRLQKRGGLRIFLMLLLLHDPPIPLCPWSPAIITRHEQPLWPFLMPKITPPFHDYYYYRHFHYYHAMPTISPYCSLFFSYRRPCPLRLPMTLSATVSLLLSRCREPRRIWRRRHTACLAPDTIIITCPAHHAITILHRLPISPAIYYYCFSPTHQEVHHFIIITTPARQHHRRLLFHTCSLLFSWCHVCRQIACLFAIFAPTILFDTRAAEIYCRCASWRGLRQRLRWRRRWAISAGRGRELYTSDAFIFINASAMMLLSALIVKTIFFIMLMPIRYMRTAAVIIWDALLIDMPPALLPAWCLAMLLASPSTFADGATCRHVCLWRRAILFAHHAPRPHADDVLPPLSMTPDVPRRARRTRPTFAIRRYYYWYHDVTTRRRTDTISLCIIAISRCTV